MYAFGCFFSTVIMAIFNDYSKRLKNKRLPLFILICGAFSSWFIFPIVLIAFIILRIITLFNKNLEQKTLSIMRKLSY